MVSYDLSVDTDSGVIFWRLPATLPDADMTRIEAELNDMIDAARAAWGRMRLLVDLQTGEARPTPALMAFIDRLRLRVAPGDRCAVLIPSSLAKIAMKSEILAMTKTFLSDGAAMTWLTAWDEVRMPALETCRL